MRLPALSIRFLACTTPAVVVVQTHAGSRGTGTAPASRTSIHSGRNPCMQFHPKERRYDAMPRLRTRLGRLSVHQRRRRRSVCAEELPQLLAAGWTTRVPRGKQVRIPANWHRKLRPVVVRRLSQWAACTAAKADLLTSVGRGADASWFGVWAPLLVKGSPLRHRMLAHGGHVEGLPRPRSATFEIGARCTARHNEPRQLEIDSRIGLVDRILSSR